MIGHTAGGAGDQLTCGAAKTRDVSWILEARLAGEARDQGRLARAARRRAARLRGDARALAGRRRALPRLARRIERDGALWISWPKRASGVSTDLDENVVRAIGLASSLVDVKVCAVDDTWSGLKFVYRLADRPKTAKKK